MSVSGILPRRDLVAPQRPYDMELYPARVKMPFSLLKISSWKVHCFEMEERVKKKRDKLSLTTICRTMMAGSGDNIW